MELMEKIMELKKLQKKTENMECGYKCPKCKDTEQILYKKDGIMYSKDCECKKQNDNERKLNRTALASKKDVYTFERYNANEEWQKNILHKAKAYIEEPQGWFYIGGQVGAGKTHICTAMTRNLASVHNLNFEYILFNQKMTELKQDKFEEKEKYTEELNKLINTDILFIDDLFKVNPTNADLDILFDIVNNRYLNNKICIISSEKYLNDILEIDSAIGSRIFEKCKENVFNISRDDSRNYRLK